MGDIVDFWVAISLGIPCPYVTNPPERGPIRTLLAAGSLHHRPRQCSMARQLWCLLSSQPRERSWTMRSIVAGLRAAGMTPVGERWL
jgi:hypothetical protein